MDKSKLQGLQSQSRYEDFLDLEPSLVASRAEGVYVETMDERRLIDLCAGYWIAALGYGHEEIVDTMQEAANTLSYWHLFGTAHEPAVALSKRLLSLTSDTDFSKVMFANSGSGAMEVALHLAARYAAERNIEEPAVAALERGFHGSTFIEQCLTPYRRYPETLDISQSVHFLSSPMDEEKARQGLEALENLAATGNLAAFVAEPVQGIGGVVIPPSWYFPEVRRICDEHDVLLIYDEVSTGIGATGEWFGYQTVGAVPDVMALGKRLSGGYFPVSATLANDKFEPIFQDGFGHGHATSGHPIGCNVTLKVLEIIEREGLIGQVQEKGEHLRQKLHERLAPLLGEDPISSIGLMASVDVGSNDIAERIRSEGIDQGIVVIPEGRYLILCPPYIITKEQLNESVKHLEAATKAVLQEEANATVGAGF
jgi:putrescine aminotransferase